VETDFYSKMEDSFSMAVQYSQPAFVPAIHKPDRLAERVNSLSHARDYRLDNTPEGLIDSLPTEGLSTFFTVCYIVDIGMDSNCHKVTEC